jgi:hypothetical protein
MKTITNLTELETLVLESISQGDYYDDMPTECIENLKDNLNISTKILRGVLSSLVQKDLVRLGEFPNGLTSFSLRNN